MSDKPTGDISPTKQRRERNLKRVISSLYEDTLYAMNTGDISHTIPENVYNFLPPQCMYDRLKSRKRKSSDASLNSQNSQHNLDSNYHSASTSNASSSSNPNSNHSLHLNNSTRALSPLLKSSNSHTSSNTNSLSPKSPKTKPHRTLIDSSFLYDSNDLSSASQSSEDFYSYKEKKRKKSSSDKNSKSKKKSNKNRGWVGF